MRTFIESLEEGYSLKDGCMCFTFGDNKEYQLCFEPLLTVGQFYVALYKNKNLLTTKVVIKPGL